MNAGSYKRTNGNARVMGLSINAFVKERSAQLVTNEAKVSDKKSLHEQRGYPFLIRLVIPIWFQKSLFCLLVKDRLWVQIKLAKACELAATLFLNGPTIKFVYPKNKAVLE